jgi:hypothetical protein
MRIVRGAPPLVVVGFSAVLLAGCGSNSGSSSPSSYSTPTTQAPTASSSEPGQVESTSNASAQRGLVEPEPSTRQQQVLRLPVGRVPGQLVGRWSGGIGDRTGEYLIIAEDGSYARGRNGSMPYSQGVIVSQGVNFMTYDTDGTQHVGQWDYTNAAGIEVLGVVFDGDYYSYAR